MNWTPRNVLKLWNSTMEEKMHMPSPAQCSLGLVMLNRTGETADLHTYPHTPTGPYWSPATTQWKSYHRFLPWHDWQCTVCLFSRSLASRGTQNVCFVVQELRSHVPEFPADKNNVSPLTSQAGSSGSADSRNMSWRGKDISRFQQPFISWGDFRELSCHVLNHGCILLCQSAFASCTADFSYASQPTAVSSNGILCNFWPTLTHWGIWKHEIHCSSFLLDSVTLQQEAQVFRQTHGSTKIQVTNRLQF